MSENNESKTATKNCTTILSIDGGGIKGVIPARIIEELEKDTYLGQPISQFFDIVAGTSTGGLIALGVTIPKDGSAVPRTGAELVDVYRKQGKKIFPDSGSFRKTLSDVVRTLSGYGQAKFSPSGLNGVLKKLFASKTLADISQSKTLLITSYDMTLPGPRVFSSRENGDKGLAAAALARATSAAPTFFPARQIGDDGFVDGGVFANNPALVAFAEAAAQRPDDYYILISLGTGRNAQRYSYNQLKDWSEIEWISPLVQIMFAGGSATTHETLTRLASISHSKLKYYKRINIDISPDEDTLDNAEKAESLWKRTEEQLTTPDLKAQLMEICQILRDPTIEASHIETHLKQLPNFSPQQNEDGRWHIIESMRRPLAIAVFQTLVSLVTFAVVLAFCFSLSPFTAFTIASVFSGGFMLAATIYIIFPVALSTLRAGSGGNASTPTNHSYVLTGLIFLMQLIPIIYPLLLFAILWKAFELPQNVNLIVTILYSATVAASRIAVLMLVIQRLDKPGRLVETAPDPSRIHYQFSQTDSAPASTS